MIVPSERGYGKNGNGAKVPPHSILEFDICIEEVQVSDFEPFNLFASLDINKDLVLTEEEMLPLFVKIGDGEVPDDVWDIDDKDKDHLISWEEFRGSKGKDPNAKEEEEEKADL